MLQRRAEAPEARRVGVDEMPGEDDRELERRGDDDRQQRAAQGRARPAPMAIEPDEHGGVQERRHDDDRPRPDELRDGSIRPEDVRVARGEPDLVDRRAPDRQPREARREDEGVRGDHERPIVSIGQPSAREREDEVDEDDAADPDRGLAQRPGQGRRDHPDHSDRPDDLVQHEQLPHRSRRIAPVRDEHCRHPEELDEEEGRLGDH